MCDSKRIGKMSVFSKNFCMIVLLTYDKGLKYDKCIESAFDFLKQRWFVDLN